MQKTHTPAASALSRRSFLGSALGATFSLTCLPKSVYAKLGADADASGNDVVLRFAAMSDVHFNGDPNSAETKRFARALEFMYEYSAKQKYDRFDALVVAGDISNHGVEKEIALFKKTMDAGIKGDTKTVICMGNHEFYGGNKPLWEKTFGVPGNRRYEVNGFQFIAISPEKGTCGNGDYNYALDWLEKELDAAEAADPKKPIFVLQHYHITPTVYGSRGDDNWGTSDLFEPLQKRPRVIDFSGHSHYPINDPRSAWQGRFSAFGTGTLSYFEMGGEGGKYDKFPAGYRDAAQMYIVEVRRDNSVALKPFDLITETFFDVVYLISEPGAVEKYRYTDKRYQTSEKPSWTDGAKAVLKETFPTAAIIEFPQAVCKDVVHSYRAEIERRAPNGDWKPFATEYFWSEYYFKNAPKTMKIELELEELSEYRAKIVALNPYFKESETALNVAFSTPRDESETVDKNAPSPDANVLDLTFASGAPVNAAKNALPKQKAVETLGAPKIKNGAAHFDGKDDCYKIQFSSADYRKLRRATIAAKFKIDEFPNGASDVFANTEGVGLALEINGKAKTLELWASVGGYQIISAPLETGKFVDAFGTFDGSAVVLYIDGKEVARKAVSGILSHPQSEPVQAFFVGADVAPGGVGSAFFKGAVERARLFNWALTAEQVANLSGK